LCVPAHIVSTKLHTATKAYSPRFRSLVCGTRVHIHSPAAQAQEYTWCEIHQTLAPL